MSETRPQWRHIPRRSGGGPKRFTDTQERAIAQAHRDGSSIRDLARTYDVSRGLIARTLRRVRDAERSSP